MTEIARVTKHPADAACVLVHVPPTLNDQMGRFGPARLSVEHHAYVLHHSHIDALFRFAHSIDVHLVDDRMKGPRGPGPLPVECRSCAQPGKRFDPPNVCPACGEPWQPITPPIREAAGATATCAQCRHRQAGAFPFCSKCGASMPPPLTGTRGRVALPAPVIAPEPRVHLDDPLPIAQATKPPALPAHVAAAVDVDPADVRLVDGQRVDARTGQLLDDDATIHPYDDPDYDPAADVDPTVDNPWSTSTSDEPEPDEPPDEPTGEEPPATWGAGW